MFVSVFSLYLDISQSVSLSACLPVCFSFSFCFIVWSSISMSISSSLSQYLCLSICLFLIFLYLPISLISSFLWFTVFVLREFMIPQLLPVVSLPEVTINFTIIWSDSGIESPNDFITQHSLYDVGAKKVSAYFPCEYLNEWSSYSFLINKCEKFVPKFSKTVFMCL